MIRRLQGAIGAVCLLASMTGATAAHATGPVDFNVLVFENFTGFNSDVEGSLAAGGKINITGYSVGEKLTDNTQNTLIGGQSITAGSGSLKHGNAISPDNSGISGQFTVNNGQIIEGSGLNFTDLKTYYTSKSTVFAGMASTGSVTNEYGTLKLTGSASGINVFTLNASDLTNIYGVDINLASSNDYALINVIGGSISLPNVGYGGNLATSHILYNFNQATSINVGSFRGSILAPNADLNTSSGGLNGQVIAKSFYGPDQVNLYLTDSAFYAATSTPEASTWFMMIAGFGIIGTTLRRRGKDKLATTQALAA